MKKLSRIWALAILCLPVGTVVAQDVRYNYDEKADFSKYKTYKWEQHPDSLQLDSLTLTQLGESFDAELAKKGLIKKDKGDTELVIVYQIAFKEDKQIDTYGTGYSTGPYWGRRWYGTTGGSFSTTVTTIPIGSVDLDFYDTATKTLVWRGQATKTIDPDAKPEKRKKNMAKAAEKMLKNYPPKKK